MFITAHHCCFGALFFQKLLLMKDNIILHDTFIINRQWTLVIRFITPKHNTTHVTYVL